MKKATSKASEKISKKQAKTDEVLFREDLVSEVRSDFKKRAEDKRGLEARWQLNANFVSGRQHMRIGPRGDVIEEDREYYWQEREVYNHIAPIIETRLAKLGRVRPKMSVRPFSSDDDDIKTAKIAEKVLDSCCSKINLDEKIRAATYWSELTGSVFYKVSWDRFAGKKLGKSGDGTVFEGDVRIDVCPPYEIYPSDIMSESLESVTSIIHAKAVEVKEVKRIYGVDVAPEKVDVLTFGGAVSQLLGNGGLGRDYRTDSCIVIERYSRPTKESPDGEFVIVAGDKLLYSGPLPYINGEDGSRDLPFIRQEALKEAGSFFGVSMVERAIPVQRAYNAVKNRKHEFMNRISMGVLAVEDGSVDTANLEEEGLSPGKILVYRQGSAPPRLLDPGSVPNDFLYEEDRLLSEFISLSGVSEIMRSSSVPSSLSSGVALQMLIEQDDTRLSLTAEHIRNAVKTVAKHILRLYKQFASEMRMSRVSGREGREELLYWDASDIGCDDVVFDTENELNSTPAVKQNMMFELLKMGLLTDSDGRLSDATRYKVLEVLGWGGFEATQDKTKLHVTRAEKENRRFSENKETHQEVLEVDDHDIHIEIHTKFLLSADFEKFSKKNASLKDAVLTHIRAHKQYGAISESLNAPAAPQN